MPMTLTFLFFSLPRCGSKLWWPAWRPWPMRRYQSQFSFPSTLLLCLCIGSKPVLPQTIWIHTAPSLGSVQWSGHVIFLYCCILCKREVTRTSVWLVGLVLIQTGFSSFLLCRGSWPRVQWVRSWVCNLRRSNRSSLSTLRRWATTVWWWRGFMLYPDYLLWG